MRYDLYDFESATHILIGILGAFMIYSDLTILNTIWLLVLGCILFVLAFVLAAENSHQKRRKVETAVTALQNDDFFFRMADVDWIDLKLNKILELMQQNKIQIASQEQLFKIIFDEITIGIIVADKEDNIILSNIETHIIFNRSAFTHMSQFAEWDNLDKVLAEMDVYTKRHVSIKTPQKELNLSIHCNSFMLRDQEMRIFSFNDIRNEIDRNEFDSWIKLTRVLTHEIMNGIAPISSLSDSMKQETDIPEHIKDGLEAISTSSHSLINFVNSYRRFTNIPTPAPRIVPVSKLIKQVKDLYPHTNITASIKPDDMALYADEALIMQVFTNIVKNAIEALNGQEDAEIRFNCYQNEDELDFIEISNNGPAIPKEEINEIFIPFFTTKENGSGIGLAISRQIMILSGGSLSLTSTPSHKFTTTFTLAFC